MRISDWSSDVCSSDLPFTRRQAAPLVHEEQNGHSIPARDRSNEYSGICEAFPAAQPRPEDEQGARRDIGEVQIQKRSEEHTSELQSLMRISYAVFCLKKKKIKKHKPQTTTKSHVQQIKQDVT